MEVLKEDFAREKEEKERAINEKKSLELQVDALRNELRIARMHQGTTRMHSSLSGHRCTNSLYTCLVLPVSRFALSMVDCDFSSYSYEL